MWLSLIVWKMNLSHWISTWIKLQNLLFKIYNESVSNQVNSPQLGIRYLVFSVFPDFKNFQDIQQYNNTESIIKKKIPFQNNAIFNKLKHSSFLASSIVMKTIENVIKVTKLIKSAKFSIIHALKCQKKPLKDKTQTVT